MLKNFLRMSAISQTILSASCSKSIDSYNLFAVCIHDWDNGNRIAIVI